MNKQHHYELKLNWADRNNKGTINYTSYTRDYEIFIENKPTLFASSDPVFRGDKTKHNPEDMLLSSISSCHMLWYLHLCADAGIVVLNYVDNATGIMVETENGSGHFIEVTLNPIVTISDSAQENEAIELHEKADEMCFIANSVNFPIKHIPVIKINSHV